MHRDIKPQNVMLDRDGNVKVTDFGIARAGDSGMTEAGSILGTAQYLAPEQAQGQPVDERSDLYSVGIVLYEMLTGTVPFKGDTAVTVALKHVNEMAAEPAQLVPGLPYSLNQIVLKAIAKDPAQRYQTADQFARDLRAAQVGGPVTAATFDSGAERTSVIAGAAGGGGTAVMTRPPLDAVALGSRPQAPALADRPRRRAPAPGDRRRRVRARPRHGRRRGDRAVRRRAEQGRRAHHARGGGLQGQAQEEYSDKYAAGLVTRQAPAAGTKLRKGETVDIWVSKGSASGDAQRLQGLAARRGQDLAQRQRSARRPEVGQVGAVPQGQVYKQDPAAGSTVQKGDTITYWVSSGKPQATVPDLSTLTQADAQTALTTPGSCSAPSRTQTSTTVPSGQVIRQNPTAGTKVAKGSSVSIIVSSGTPSASPSPTASGVAVPNVYGMDSTTAADTLTGLGFNVVVKQKGGTGQPPGTVVMVTPDAGSVIPSGSTVVLTIAK